jgi:tetratricopeptide (TPR) repeat protein
MFSILIRHILIIIIFFGSSLAHASIADDERLDALYSTFMEKVVGKDGNPATYGVPAEGNFLDLELVTDIGPSSYINKLQYESVYRSHLADMIERRTRKGPFLPGDDFVDYLLTRSDGGPPFSMRVAFTATVVSEEIFNHYRMASDRYFMMIRDNQLVRHHQGFSKDERVELVALAEKDAAANHRLYTSLVRSGLTKLMDHPVEWEVFMHDIRNDLLTTSEDFTNKFKKERDLLRKMSMAVIDDSLDKEAIVTCIDQKKGVEEKRVKFAQHLFGLNSNLNDLRQGEMFREFAESIEKYDACVLSLFNQYKESERSLFLINMMLTFGDSWARAKKNLHSGYDLLFIEEVIREVKKYASLRDNIMEYPFSVYLQGNNYHVPLIKNAVNLFLRIRHHIIILKDREGKDAPAAYLFAHADGKESGPVPVFGQWLFSLSDKQRELNMDKRLEASMNRLQLGRLYMMDENYGSANEHFLAAVTLAPTYWRAWQFLGRSADHLNKRYESAQAFRKVVSLLDRCLDNESSECEDAPQQNAEYGKILFGAGHAHMHIAEYKKAADLFLRASRFVPDNFERSNVEWLAISRFAVSGLETAWKEYRQLFKGMPLPNFYEGSMSADEFRSQQEPPAAFLKMIRSGLLDMSYFAGEGERTFASYIHAQNAARVEALADRHERGREDTRDLLLELYVKLSSSQNGQRVQPALSERAASMGQLGEKAVDSGDYIKAEQLYRAAVTTDPWWLAGLYNLARLELINWGHCGPTETLSWMKKVYESGVVPFNLHPMQVNPYGQIVKGLEAELEKLYRAAELSDSGNVIGLCDKPGAVYIRPDRAVIAE